MNFSTKFLPTVILVLLVVCFTATTAWAARSGTGPDENPVADLTITADGITWMPRVNYAELVLTISRPEGANFQKTFKAGTTPGFELSEIGGIPLVDGSYTYELRVVPVEPRRIREDSETAKELPQPTETLTQTGYFTIRAGAIVTPSLPETIASPMDIIHSDDVIIDGSLCVGNDCYSGLAFGFDTIVLMENNLRIFFDDTSTIQNYPRNDWRIIANDSTDGGGNYFAIEDATEVSNILVLEAGAPDNSLYVDSHGDVGINTSTPYYELHIVDGDSPAVRLDQDGSYGWTPQKWDLCGNESNFFIRDATHASKLPFRIEPEAPTNSIFIKSDGKVGMGTGSPSAQFEIERTGENAAVVFERTDGATGKFTARPSEVYIGSGSDHNVRIVANNNVVMTVEPGGDVGIGNTNPGYKLVVGTSGAYCDGGNWVDGSSLEYKENVRTLSGEEALATLKGLDPVKFNYKADKSEEWLGFIAEDVPDLVATKDRKGMSPMDVAAVLTRVVKQQQEAMQMQQNAMQAQQRVILELKNRILELEKKLK